jgi:hypothetical protein
MYHRLGQIARRAFHHSVIDRSLSVKCSDGNGRRNVTSIVDGVDYLGTNPNRSLHFRLKLKIACQNDLHRNNPLILKRDFTATIRLRF